MAKGHKEVRKITAGLIFSWIFGVLFGISGLSFLFTGSIIAGGSLILASLILLPPVNKFSKEKFNFELSRGLKITLVIILFVIYAVSLSNSGISNIDTSSSSNQQITNQNQEETQPSQNTETITTPTTTPDVEEESDTATIGEKNALAQAQSYLSFSAFSYSGLIEQLEFEGYSHTEAVYGADNSGADWNEQAALKAQSYLDYSPFSREGLIEQLEFEGFTREQAEYGVEAVGY